MKTEAQIRQMLEEEEATYEEEKTRLHKYQRDKMLMEKEEALALCYKIYVRIQLLKEILEIQ